MAPTFIFLGRRDPLLTPVLHRFHPGYLTAERLAKAKKLKLAVTAGIGALPPFTLDAARFEYAGPAPGVGLDQVNIQIPRTLIGSGEVNLVLTVDGKAANTIKVNFK